MTDTGTNKAIGNMLKHTTEYYQQCLMPSAEDIAKELAVTAVKSLAKLSVGLVCPPCMTALPAYNAALVL